MKKQTKLLFSCILMLVVKICSAQLYFKNTTEQPITLAIGYYFKTDGYEGWYSDGWYEVEPGDTKMLIEGALQNQYYFYYAKSSTHVWEGKGKYKFVVDNINAFTIKNADKEYQTGLFKKFKPFRKIDVGTKTKYTLTFTSGHEEE